MALKIDDDRRKVHMIVAVTPSQRAYFQEAAKALGETCKAWMLVNLCNEAEKVLGISFAEFRKEHTPKRFLHGATVNTSSQQAIKNLGLDKPEEKATEDKPTKGESNGKGTKSIWD